MKEQMLLNVNFSLTAISQQSIFSTCSRKQNRTSDQRGIPGEAAEDGQLPGYQFKLSFGNRIMKQMYDFIPVYVACGGTELGGMDYIIARKVLKKFESMNVTFVRDEITGLINYIDKTFGKAEMEDSKSYLRRIQNLY